VTLGELVLDLLLWVGVATGQPPAAPPPMIVVPASLLHYQYCKASSALPLDDCLAERFASAALYDPATGAIYVSQRFTAANPADRVSLLVQLVRYEGESALGATGGAAGADRHESPADCGIRFEQATRDLGRAYLRADGVAPGELPGLEVADGMAPWTCRAAQPVRESGG
jgi:hypothetical protein